MCLRAVGQIVCGGEACVQRGANRGRDGFVYGGCCWEGAVWKEGLASGWVACCGGACGGWAAGGACGGRAGERRGGGRVEIGRAHV